MQEKDIIKTLKAEADRLAVPDVFDKIITADMGSSTDSDDILMQNRITAKKSSRPFYLRLTAAVAAVLILAIGFGFMFNSLMFRNTIYAKISIDINPSIEISVNKNYKVVDIACLNDAANDIVNVRAEKKKQVGLAIKSIIKNAIEQKYIMESADNVILISIAGADDVFYGKLKTIICDNIDSAYDGMHVNQIFEEYSHELKEQAHEYGISVGKLKRIKYAYSLNSNGLTEDEFINFMKNRSIVFIQKYIEDNQK